MTERTLSPATPDDPAAPGTTKNPQELPGADPANDRPRDAPNDGPLGDRPDNLDELQLDDDGDYRGHPLPTGV